jgi:hypothetical protein
VRPPAAPRGTMLIFCTGSYSGISAPISAWPACAPDQATASQVKVQAGQLHSAPGVLWHQRADQRVARLPAPDQATGHHSKLPHSKLPPLASSHFTVLFGCRPLQWLSRHKCTTPGTLHAPMLQQAAGAADEEHLRTCYINWKHAKHAHFTK